MIVLAYAVFSGLWILLSDRAVAWLFDGPSAITLASTLKGWLFVAVTSLLLYGLLLRMAGGAKDAPVEVPAVLPTWPFLLLAAAVIAVTVGLSARNTVQLRARETDRLQTIADLKVRQIGDWLMERQGDAEFLRTSPLFAEQYRRWRDTGDAAAGALLQSRLEQMRRHRGGGAVLLLDADLQRVWGTADASATVSEPLRAAATAALRDRQVKRAGPYRGEAGHLRFDFVAPLIAAKGRPPLLVIQIRPADWLLPMLQEWPVPSISAEAQLFRRDGDAVLFLGELRHRKDTAGRLRLPLSDKTLLAAQVARGEARKAEAAVGLDYRGVAVRGVARAVPGTDWFLLAKMDEAEIEAEAAKDRVAIGLAGLFALFMVGAGHALLRQRSQLAHGEAMRAAQAERLRSLKLLAAVADGSDDAVFAKDMDGRYLIYNRAAARFAGIAPETALGRDDGSIFPPEVAERLRAVDLAVMAANETRRYEEAIPGAGGDLMLDVTKGPLRDESGTVVGLFGIARDITERKRSETALRESEARLRLIAADLAATLRAVPDLLFELDGQGRYLAVKASQETLLAAPVDHLLGHTVSEVLPPEAAGTVMAALAAAGRNGVDYGRTIVLPLVHGPRYFELSVARKTVNEGQRESFIVLSRDISSRKADEEELRQRNAELERFNAATVGRELDMIELKRRINALSRELGREAPYPLAFLDAPRDPP